jgi:adenylate kinase
MAPITDDQVNSLKAQVKALEKRIYELEQKASGAPAPNVSDQMRMILIGPPGAGTCSALGARRSAYSLY